jgi:hypothetical protein
LISKSFKKGGSGLWTNKLRRTEHMKGITYMGKKEIKERGGRGVHYPIHYIIISMPSLLLQVLRSSVICFGEFSQISTFKMSLLLL